MRTKAPLIRSFLFVALCLFAGCANAKQATNFVIIFLDDAGYADFSPLGSPDYPTPNVDRLAAEGTVFPRFYVPQAVCSASRASLLSGCYPERTKIFGSIDPRERGLEPKFTIISEHLKQAGYRTAFFGKWHIGDDADTQPQARGFDETAGLMYSNDMWKYNPAYDGFFKKWKLHYYENAEVTIDDVEPEDQTQLTTWYTEKAVDFIQRSKDEPFFLYLPHSMPHTPLYVSDKFAGKSGEGLYGDVAMELDWSVGEIMRAIKEAGVEENTMIIFTSDNGPWTLFGNHGGKTPFRGCKGTAFDGGVRSGCIVKLPSGIPQGKVSNRMFGSIDLMPTLLEYAGIEIDTEAIDGRNVRGILEGKPDAVNPQEYYAFSYEFGLKTIMSPDGRWKLMFPQPYSFVLRPGMDGAMGLYGDSDLPYTLFDLDRDPYETTNVFLDHPEVAGEMLKQGRAHQKRFF